MINHNIILIIVYLICGYQGLRHVEASTDLAPDILAYIDNNPNTINRLCNIDQGVHEGSYIATGLPESYQNDINPSISANSESDLWDIIAKSFEIQVPNERRVKYYKRWYLENSFHIDTVSARAEPFLFYIYQKVKQRKMPGELALIPFIESSFDQFAHSNRGAAGLWQITIPTGKAFGLEYLKGYDGRRDIITSTDAALDLLDYLYKKFNGNWLHAIAAYNTGEGRVRKAIKENKSNGKPTDFWSLQLPKETRLYVPKLLAMADLLKHRYKHDLTLNYIKPEPVLSEIVISHRVELQIIASHAGLSRKALYGLNPGYTRGYTFHDRDNRILIPKSTREALYSYDYVKHKFTIHHIKPGESLSELAYLNNTTVSLIKNANDLSDSIIFAGQQLLIPVR